MWRGLLSANVALEKVFSLNILSSICLTIESEIVANRGYKHTHGDETLLSINDGKTAVFATGGYDRSKKIVLKRRGDSVAYVTIQVLNLGIRPRIWPLVNRNDEARCFDDASYPNQASINFL
jgi:hypothetical protein